MITENHRDFIEKIKVKNPKFKLMGLDVGQNKIGLAFTSYPTLIPTPFKTLMRKNKKYDLDLLTTLCKEHLVDGIVIGLPILNDGSEGVSSVKTRHFAEMLNEIIGLPITFQDERSTTNEASSMLQNIGLKRKNRDKIDDQVSAQLILDRFILGLSKFN